MEPANAAPAPRLRGLSIHPAAISSNGASHQGALTAGRNATVQPLADVDRAGVAAALKTRLGLVIRTALRLDERDAAGVAAPGYRATRRAQPTATGPCTGHRFGTGLRAFPASTSLHSGVRRRLASGLAARTGAPGAGDARTGARRCRRCRHRIAVVPVRTARGDRAHPSECTDAQAARARLIREPEIFPLHARLFFPHTPASRPTQGRSRHLCNAASGASL